MKPKNKLYWEEVDDNFNKVNTILKWILIPSTIIIMSVIYYFNF